MKDHFLVLDNDIGFEGLSSEYIAKKCLEISPQAKVDIYPARMNHFPEGTNGYNRIILNGSSASAYSDLPWVNRLKYFVQQTAPEIPLFGICFGHQVIASVYGCTVERSPHFEVGWRDICLNQEKISSEKGSSENRSSEKWSSGNEVFKKNNIFEGLPAKIKQFQIHNDTITKISDAVEVIAQNEFGIQAIKVKDRAVYGVQFHPEISLEASKYILERRRDQLEKANISVEDCLSVTGSVSENSYASNTIFENFLVRIGVK